MILIILIYFHKIETYCSLYEPGRYAGLKIAILCFNFDFMTMFTNFSRLIYYDHFLGLILILYMTKNLSFF